MPLQPILIAGEWHTPENPVDTFNSVNPATKSPLPDTYPISDFDDIERALQAGQEAVSALRSLSPAHIAHFLELFAANIEARADDLVEMANLETALPAAPRLRDVELPRTTNQLRLAAEAARNRSWSQATLDTATNIRSKLGPLGGPVVVFGPNNFPFAFNSVAGGDFAAAIAAGNPVIAKGNPAHPGTTKLLAEAAFDAAQQAGLPAGMVQLLYHTPPEVGLRLVSHPLVGATAFTGSKHAGLRLKEAADKAGKPIYLEMSSVNPIFILPGALQERLAEIAEALFSSCTLAAGQFCTNPGLTIIQQSEHSEAFIEAVKSRFEANRPGTLLSAAGPNNIAQTIELLQKHGVDLITGGQEADTPGYAFNNTVLRVSGDAFIQEPDVMQTEAFGPVTLIVVAQDTAQLAAIAAQLEGNLTGCFYSHTQGDDDAIYDQVEPIVREKVGRLLNDKMPTGVAVVPSMNHGGPYPATGHPGFTAVGIPASLLRFAALYSYDNVRHHRLPPELQDKNPTGTMWRFIDGEWTQRDV
ncbi:MAG: aldehyde dehydrogenase (NADP(+)) [Anaerolineae bacterium]|nr:aldehyde dehydrogenase (NADP(+)) [Anaerolineae bacterium]